MQDRSLVGPRPRGKKNPPLWFRRGGRVKILIVLEVASVVFKRARVLSKIEKISHEIPLVHEKFLLVMEPKMLLIGSMGSRMASLKFVRSMAGRDMLQCHAVARDGDDVRVGVASGRAVVRAGDQVGLGTSRVQRDAVPWVAPYIESVVGNGDRLVLESRQKRE